MATTQKEAISKRRQALRDEHAQAVREKIKTTALVQRLENFALGLKSVRMTAAQIKATEMLLDKTMPNLASVKHEVDAKQVVFLIDTAFTDDDPTD